MSEKFQFSTPIQIRFSDLDMLAHVNNAKYLTYMEYARIAYIDHLLGDSVDWNADGIILAKAVIDYKMPVFLKDKIEIGIRCSRIGSKSFDIEYQIVRFLDNELTEIVATGLTVMVAYNYASNKTIEIPATWRNLIEQSM